MDNYKAYSLQELEVWVREAVEADCTPQEIYASIVETVKNNMKYHRACYRDSVKLLSLLRGKGELEIIESGEDWRRIEDPSYTQTDYWEGRLEGKDFAEALAKYGYEFTPTGDINLDTSTDK